MKKVNLNTLSELLQKLKLQPIKKFTGYVDKDTYTLIYYANGIEFKTTIPERTDVPVGFNKTTARNIIERKIFNYVQEAFPSYCKSFFGGNPEFEDFQSGPPKEKSILTIFQSIMAKEFGGEWLKE